MWTGNRSLERSAAQLRSFTAALSHARWFLLAWILVSAGAGLWYAMAAKAEFVAKVDVLIEPQQIARSGLHGQPDYNRLGASGDEALTELRVLCSDGVLRSALDDIRRAGTSQRFEEGHGAALMPSPSTPLRERSLVFDSFAGGARCLRLGLSHVIELSYRAQEPNFAAQAANAISAAYARSRLARAQASVERAAGAYRERQAAGLLAEIARTRDAGSGRATPDADLTLAGARILGAAVPPPERSSPRTTPIVLLATAFGAISGVMLTLLRAGVSLRTSLVQGPAWAVSVSHARLSTEGRGPSGVR